MMYFDCIKEDEKGIEPCLFCSMFSVFMQGMERAFIFYMLCK